MPTNEGNNRMDDGKKWWDKYEKKSPILRRKKIVILERNKEGTNRNGQKKIPNDEVKNIHSLNE